MLLNYEINTNLEINSLMDLSKLKDLQNNGLKVNKSELARRLGKDRRTIAKYINGFEKSTSRKRTSQFDAYYDIIDQLLKDNYKVFAYKRVLWQYLKDNHGLTGAQSSFMLNGTLYENTFVILYSTCILTIIVTVTLFDIIS